VKLILYIFFFLAHKTLFSQTRGKADSLNIKPELFTSGFIDVMNNGQVNASARFIKLYIGEPGKFCVPLSFYSGVSNNNFQSQSALLQKTNEHLVNQYINPMSGLVNISIDGNLYFNKPEKATRYGLIYQCGERLLNGIRAGPINDPQTGKSVNFLNSFASVGILFQTGAWEKTNTKNVGIFWMTWRFHICYTSPEKIKGYLPNIETNGIYNGNSIGFGIEINNLVNIKAIYYKYFKKPEIEYGLPIYQFSFNYQLQK